MECTEYIGDTGYVDNTEQECTEHAEHRGMKTIEIIECMERIGCIEYIKYIESVEFRGVYIEQSIQSM